MRKNLLSKIMLLLACMLVGGSAWADKSTLNFEAACNGSGTADDGAVWTVTSDAEESTFDSGAGVHYGTNSKEVSYVQLETSDIDGTITEVIVNARDAQAKATITVTVGGTKFTCTDPIATNTPTDYTFKGAGSGKVVVKVDRGSSMKKAIYVKKVVVTYAKQAASPLASIGLSGEYPTTFKEGDVFSYDGMVVTATYEDDSENDVTSFATFSGYDMNTAGYQTVTVSYTEGEVTKTATYQITVTAVPTHNVIWSINGSTTEPIPYKEGEAIEFLDNPGEVEGLVFQGWVTTAINGTTDEKPEFVTSATMGESDLTFFAVFANVEGDITEITDELDNNLIGNTSSGYGDWNGIKATSNAVYAGCSNGRSDKIIQIRTDNNNSGIVTTTSGGKIAKIVVTWDGTVTGRTLDVYGNNSAYENAAALYNTKTQGTKLGSIVCGTSTELTIDGDYEFIGMRSASGAMYFSNIAITWKSGSSTITGYCTTVAEDTRKEAGISFAEAAITKEIVEAYEGQALTNPNNLTVAWTSSNEKVATVDAEGKVTVLAIGETTITAKFAGNDAYKSATVFYTLTIQDSREALELAFAEESVSVNINDKVAAPTLNGNANNEAITYTSSNEAIATVDAQTGEVTGVAKGKATITATIAATNQHLGGTATFTVNVIDPNLMEDVFVLDETRGWENATAYASDEGVYGSLIASKGTNTNEPKYYSNGTATRFYNGNTLTVASSIKGIKSVEFTVTQGSGVSANNAHYEKSESEFVWTVTEGMAVNTLVFNFTEQVRITKITVNYAEITAPAAVAISDAKYATFASANTVDFSKTGITAYAAKYNSKANSVRLTEIEDGIVPANTAVVLYAEEAVNATIPFAVPTTVVTSDLKVSDGTITGAENIFALANNATYGVGFYNVASTVTIPAGKAYLEIPVGSEAREFIGFENEATGIVAVGRETLRQQGAYTLSGQRIAAPAKGLYIVNGKKMVIK